MVLPSFAAAFGLVGLLSLPAAAGEISGPAKVIEGDVIEVAGRLIRLQGIDAPELGQTCRWPAKTIDCGHIAKTALMDLTTAVDVVCNTRGRDPDGRLIGRCTADGFDLGRNMVHTGWARAHGPQSAPYLSTEDGARKAKRGLWRGTFVDPWEWRAK